MKADATRAIITCAAALVDDCGHQGVRDLVKTMLETVANSGAMTIDDDVQAAVRTTTDLPTAEEWSKLAGAIAGAFSALRAVSAVAKEKGGYVSAPVLRDVDDRIEELTNLVTQRGTIRKRGPYKYTNGSSDDSEE